MKNRMGSIADQPTGSVRFRIVPSGRSIMKAMDAARKRTAPSLGVPLSDVAESALAHA